MNLKHSYLVLLLLHLFSPAFAQDLTLSSYNGSQPEVTATRSITLTDGFYVPAGSSFHANIAAAPAANCVPLASSLSQDQNYIVTYTPREAFAAGTDLSAKSTCEVMQTVQYFDGLGRPLKPYRSREAPWAIRTWSPPMNTMPSEGKPGNTSLMPTPLITGAISLRP